MTCQFNFCNEAVNASSCDSSSERSFGRDCGVSKRDSEIKEKLTFHISKPDPDSDGAISTLGEERFLSSPRLSTPAKATTSEEGWTPLIDVQLSPKKALRAAMLKSRFADTIFKAKQKTLLDHGEADPMKMREEKERLERQQRAEKAKIEAQIRAAAAYSRQRAEAEWKLQREREREAARIALEKMERTVDIDDNQVILKDLEMLTECSRADHCFEVEFGLEGLGSVKGGGRVGNPLERLGLFIKEDYCIGDVYEDDEEEAILHVNGEEGEILS